MLRHRACSAGSPDLHVQFVRYYTRAQGCATKNMFIQYGALSLKTAVSTLALVTPIQRSLLFTCSRPLLAPSHRSTSLPIADTTAGSYAVSTNPFEYTIDSILMPSLSGDAAGDGPVQGAGPSPLSSLRGLVMLLLDPEAALVEDVSLNDFVSMLPKRQLRALGGNKEWLDALLGSEYYQACKDTRALRLAGITSLGQWEEHRDRVPISLYARGRLEQAYHTLTRQPKRRESDEVLAWITKTIHRAVIEELSATQQHVFTPLLAALPAATVQANEVTPTIGSAGSPPLPQGASAPAHGADDTASRYGGEAETAAAPPTPRRGKRKHVRAVEPAPAVEVRAEKRSDKEAAMQPRAEDHGTSEERETAQGNGVTGDHPLLAAKDTETAVEEYEEIEEEVEEEEAVVAIGGETIANEGKSGAAAGKVSRGASSAQIDEKLQRLAELVLTQFNSADGYLHEHRKEIKADEKNGYVAVLDEDTAQVDPLALFSAYHAAEVGEHSSVEVRALKQVWNDFNRYQIAMEEAEEETTLLFHKQKSVDTLVHGALLLRAISREENVCLDFATQLPPYGFPLLSSDTRPLGTKRPRNALHTAMSFMSVDAAGLAFKKFLSNKDMRATPFCPKIDFNAGCGVVLLAGATLHLYETSLKDAVREEEVRPHFAEAMLGVLYLVRSKVLPRLNSVVYHIVVTVLPAQASDASSSYLDPNEIMSPTTIVSVDLTGPFSNAEYTRLEALGDPLGLNPEQIRAFTCVEDIISEIEDAGVSVSHDLMQSRDDLEALLTPTFVELLPDDSATDEEASEAAKEQTTPDVRKEKQAMTSKKHRKGDIKTAPPLVAQAAQEPVAEEEEEEEEEEEGLLPEEEEEVEEEELNAPRAASASGPSKRRGGGGGRSSKHAVAPKTATYDNINELSQEENELFHRMLEEEEELENTALKERGRATGAPKVVEDTGAKGAAGLRIAPTQRRGTATPTAADELEEEQEDDEVEVVHAPVIPKALPGRKAVSSPASPSQRTVTPMAPSQRPNRTASQALPQRGAEAQEAVGDVNREEGEVEDGSSAVPQSSRHAAAEPQFRQHRNIVAAGSRAAAATSSSRRHVTRPVLRHDPNYDSPTSPVGIANEQDGAASAVTPLSQMPAIQRKKLPQEVHPAASAGFDSNDQWFKKPKRRYFS